MAEEIKPLSELLDTLTSAVTSAITAFPADEDGFLPPQDGISLLDVKNDLLLSYIQHLVFLIVLRLRGLQVKEDDNEAQSALLGKEVVKKLIELRIYLERGVKPLEGRLRYQIDKVLRAAEDADQAAARKPAAATTERRVNGTVSKRKSRATMDDSSAESNEESDEEDESEDNDEDDDIRETDERSYRPNAAALARAVTTTPSGNARQQQTSARGGGASRSASSLTGVYKPPRVTPTAMPNSTPAAQDFRPERRRKSHLLSEYIDDEFTSAPTAQPSIGSNNTILARGRSGLSSRDRAKERERTEYEERNFTRLPVESKKERRKARLRGEGQSSRDMFGGEDWTGLGGLGDRISRSVSGGRKGAGDGGMGVLQRREERKRKRDHQQRDGHDGQRGDGIGDSFEKRRRVLQARAERKMNRKGR